MFTTELGIKRYLYIQIKCFRLLGIEIFSPEYSRAVHWKMLLATLVLFLMLFVLGHYAWENRNNLRIMTEALTPFFEFALILWKSWNCLYSRKHMVALMQKIHSLSMQVKDNDKNMKILLEENLKDQRLGVLYYTSVVSAAIISLTGPMGISLYKYFKYGEFILQPSFRGTYPFENDNRPPYCFIIYMFTILVVFFGANTLLSIETMYSWYMHNIVAHFRILQQNLDQFSYGTTVKTIQNWINYHQKTLALVQDLNDLYSPIIFAQFALNSAQLGLIAFQLTQSISMADLPFMLSFLGAVIIQPAIYCYGGERVENESALVAISIYKNIKWQDWSINARRLLLFSMLRAQQSCKLTGIFFLVNLRLYLWVLRTTASYTTLLRSIK